jgi:ligand-binding sensor domain-containing protein
MRFDPGTKILTAFDPEGDPTMVMDLITDTHGNVLMATVEGVFVVDKQIATIHKISYSEYIHGNGVNWMTAVVREGKTLWIGTFRSGLIRYNLETSASIYYHADEQPGSLTGQ